MHVREDQPTVRPGQRLIRVALLIGIALLLPLQSSVGESVEILVESRAPQGKPTGKSAGNATTDPYVSILKKAGIKADEAGMRAYLDQLHPDRAKGERVAKLIQQLGSADFYAREEAMRSLLYMPVVPTDALRQASDHMDLEIAWRAREILLESQGMSSQVVLHAVLKTIASQEIKGLSGDIFAISSHCTQPYIDQAAADAIAVTVTDKDTEKLRATLKDSAEINRRWAINALATLLGENVGDELAPLLNDKVDTVRLEAARMLGNVGDRRSLTTLSQLLDAGDVKVRVQAVALLRSLTDQSFPFIAYAKEPERKKQAAAWQQWVETKGKTAILNFPIGRMVNVEMGRTLVCLYTEGRVVEIDASGKQIAELKVEGLRGPWGAQRLQNGNLLVAWFSSHKVVEYTPAGKAVWEHTGSRYPWNVHRLPNGNTLIPYSTQIVEVNPKGKVIWEQKVNSTCTDARRLRNGNTLYSNMAGKVVEIDRNGKTVWEMSGLKQPYRIQRLENGNTLVAERSGGRIQEFSPSKQVVWKKEGLRYPETAQRLANGNTLISDYTTGLQEVDPSGKTVWSKKLTSSKHTARRY